MAFDTAPSERKHSFCKNSLKSVQAPEMSLLRVLKFCKKHICYVNMQLFKMFMRSCKKTSPTDLNLLVFTRRPCHPNYYANMG